MEKDKLREKLTNLGMQACSNCGYDCEPPRRKMLCPSDVDQIIALSTDKNTSCVGLENCCDLEVKIEDARKRGGEKALRRILRESKYLSPYELIHNIKQALKALEGE